MDVIRNLNTIKEAFLSSNISVNEDIRLVSRCEALETAFIVQQKESARMFLVANGRYPYAFEILSDNDVALLLEGEMEIEDIDWLIYKKVVAFYKRYIVHGERQKVVIGFESLYELWIKEETSKKITEPVPYRHVIPVDW